MRQAIAFERAKDRAAARQAAIEARRSGNSQNADRTMDDKDPGCKVKDTRSPGAKRDPRSKLLIADFRAPPAWNFRDEGPNLFLEPLLSSPSVFLLDSVVRNC
jgi:hypothetical protein